MAVSNTKCTSEKVKEQLFFHGSSEEDIAYAKTFWKSVQLLPPMESRLVSSHISQRLRPAPANQGGGGAYGIWGRGIPAGGGGAYVRWGRDMRQMVRAARQAGEGHTPDGGRGIRQVGAGHTLVRAGRTVYAYGRD